MACPYFYPVERLSDAEWRRHPRLPLGDPYRGWCRANPKREWAPEPDTLKSCCNLGYARGRCSKFPKGNGPDAHRFSVIADSLDALTIFFVAEHDHRPCDHGSVKFSTAEGRFTNGHLDELFLEQARAYVTSYLRRKAEPEETAKHPHRR